jgi:hypothetical protein
LANPRPACAKEEYPCALEPLPDAAYVVEAGFDIVPDEANIVELGFKVIPDSLSKANAKPGIKNTI